MTDYSRHFSTRQTPQSEPIPGSTQIENSAGGYTWGLDDWGRLDRFLILGADGPTYYATERTLTRENAEAVVRCLQADGPRTVARIVEISDGGRAPKNDPAVFALALATALGTGPTRAAALAALPKVCRIGTHLFHWARAHEANGGWGRSVRRAVADWYLAKPIEGALAYQAIKYGARDGWSHKDLLRKAHPRSNQAAFRHMVGADLGARTVVRRGASNEPATVAMSYPPAEGAIPALMTAASITLNAATPVAGVCKLIREHDLPREAIAGEHLQHAQVWEALMERMPITALIRNLATLTRLGLVGPMNAGSQHVVKELGNTERLRKGRVHPIQVLAALRTYAAGKGVRGQHTWAPVSQVIDALDEAFYTCFGHLPVLDVPVVLALDVSGSMADGTVAGVPGLTPREASAALALVFMHQFPQHVCVGFTDGGWGYHGRGGERAVLTPLRLSPKQRLDDAVRAVSELPFGGTDCSLPMRWAEQQKIKADAFCVLTDSETWAGSVHPSQALVSYRQKMNRPQAKAVVCGLVSNGFSIADPADRNQLDVIGFDVAVPQLVVDFISGNVA